MKKLLLASTSLAVFAYAGSAVAADAGIDCWPESSVCTFNSNGDIHGIYSEDTKQASTFYTPNNANLTLNVSDDATFVGQFTLHNPTEITAAAGKKLFIEGYLTETLAGSNISGVDVEITKHYFAEDGVSDGALVIGNTLTAGNINLKDGARIVLWNDGNAANNQKTLTIAADKALTFEGNNIVAGQDNQTLKIVGSGKTVNEGTLTLKKYVQFGNITNNGEIVVKDGAYFAAGITNNGTITLASDAMAMAITNKGTLDLQDNVLTGGVTAAAGSTIKTLVSKIDNDDHSNDKYGKITTGTLNGPAEGKANIEVSIAAGQVIEDELTLQFATNDIKTDEKFVLKDGMYKIAFSDTAGKLIVTNKTAEEKTETLKAVGGTGNDVNSFDAWSQADLTGAPAAAQALQQAIVEASGDAAQLVGILKEITPESPTVTAGAAVSGITNTMGVIGANAFSSGSLAGKSSGDPKLKNAVWAQGLYNKAKFDKTGNKWDAKTWGLAAGADHKFDDGFKLGAGYSYTDADIKAGATKTPAKTHTIFAYGEYKPAKNWYVNGILSYSFGEYKPKSGTVSGEYDVNTFGAQFMSGYSFDWFTPEAGVRYFHVAQDGYTDSIGQKIGDSTSNIWTAVIGAKASKEFKVDSMKLIPEARLAATYDIKQGEDTTTVGVFGTNYEVKGKNLSRFGFEVGAGLTADWGAFELTAKYEGKFRSDYTDNTGILEAKYNF